MIIIKKDTKLSTIQKVGLFGGLAYGVYFSMKNKKETLPLAGYTLMFGLIGGLIGTIISETFKKD